MKVIRYTIFDSVNDGNGAEKRTAQISEILEDAGIESIYVKKDITIKVGLLNVIFRFIPVFKILRKVIPLSYYKNIKSILRAVRDYIQTEINLLPALQSDAIVFFWECTRSDNFFVPLLAKKYGKTIIAMPHNLESLVPKQISTISLKKTPLWFNEEIKYLSFCDLVFCISKEDTCLLNLFGISAFYLPYYPTKKAEGVLLRVREKRSKENRKNENPKILMLGSADNQPTMLGMIDRIDFFSNNQSNRFEIIIAGFNTEVLQATIANNGKIKILGTLDSNSLEDLLCVVDYILVHQPPTSGALTRILDMLIAGIPIITNFSSARDYFNVDGIYLYKDDEALLKIISFDIMKMPSLPKKPEEDIKLFFKKWRL